MKVKELILELQKLPQEMTVNVFDHRKNLFRGEGQSCSDGIEKVTGVFITPDNETVKLMREEGQEITQWAAIDYTNDDYTEDDKPDENGLFAESVNKPPEKNGYFEDRVNTLLSYNKANKKLPRLISHSITDKVETLIEAIQVGNSVHITTTRVLYGKISMCTSVVDNCNLRVDQSGMGVIDRGGA